MELRSLIGWSSEASLAVVVVTHWWSCGGSFVELRSLIGWSCGGSLVVVVKAHWMELWWLIGCSCSDSLVEL